MKTIQKFNMYNYSRCKVFCFFSEAFEKLYLFAFIGLNYFMEKK